MPNAVRNMASPQRWSEQAHIDLGALSQRVTGLEGRIVDIGTQIGDLSRKLDGRPTNWWAVIGGIVSLLTLIGIVFGQAIAPMNYNIDRHEREIAHIAETSINREDYLRDRAENERWLASLRDRMRSDEDNAVTRREIDALSHTLNDATAARDKVLDAAIARVDKEIDNLLDTYAEAKTVADQFQHTDERINTIVGGLNEMRHDFYLSTHSAPPATIK